MKYWNEFEGKYLSGTEADSFGPSRNVPENDQAPVFGRGFYRRMVKAGRDRSWLRFLGPTLFREHEEAFDFQDSR